MTGEPKWMSYADTCWSRRLWGWLIMRKTRRFNRRAARRERP